MPDDQGGSAPGGWWHWFQFVGAIVAVLFGLELFSHGAKGALLSFGDVDQWASGLVLSPLSAFFFGWLATVLLQSSSVVTAAAVALVLSNFPLSVAVPMVLGANVGTTATVGIIGGGWQRSWGADRHVRGIAWTHTLINLCFMPLFLLWILLVPNGNPLITLSSLSASVFAAAPAPMTGSWFDPIEEGVIYSLEYILGGPGLLAYCVEIILGLAGVVFALHRISLLLRRYFAQGAERVLVMAVNSTVFRALVIGTGLTIVFVSSSAVTVMLLPLAASGLLAVHRALPLVLGANLGTTFTALSVALALSDEQRGLALQLACFHIWVNVIMVATIISFAPLRQFIGDLSLKIADFAAAKGRPATISLIWVLVLHLALPAFALFLIWLTR